MLLAGNVYVQSMMTQSKHHMQAPASKLPAADQPLVNQSMNTPPSSGLPSPMSVSSHPIDQSSNDNIKVSKTAGMSTALGNNNEHPRVMSSVAASAIMSSGISLDLADETLLFMYVLSLCHCLQLNLNLTIVTPKLDNSFYKVILVYLCFILGGKC